DRHQGQTQEPPNDVAIGPSQSLALSPAAEGQPEGEADREEELRHDRVGIAAERIAVLEYDRRGGVRAQEVDQKHAGHGVPAKLIERRDARGSRTNGRGGSGRHGEYWRRVAKGRSET